MIHGFAKASDKRRILMKIWTAPEVREQNVGLEVTSYLPADIDII
jgi:coenzyme PQQ precursor peptide PqqA